MIMKYNLVTNINIRLSQEDFNALNKQASKIEFQCQLIVELN